ncbi:hypothetical protein D3C76_859930 [compost metagenome]
MVRYGAGHAERNAYAIVRRIVGYRFDERWDALANLDNVFVESDGNVRHQFVTREFVNLSHFQQQPIA